MITPNRVRVFAGTTVQQEMKNGLRQESRGQTTNPIAE